MSIIDPAEHATTLDKQGDDSRQTAPVILDNQGLILDKQDHACKEDDKNEQLTNSNEQVARLIAALGAAEMELMRERQARIKAEGTLLKAKPPKKATAPPVAPAPPAPHIATMKVYTDWYAERFGGPPIIGPAHWATVTKLHESLRQVSVAKTDEAAAASLQAVLDGWDGYKDLYREQTDLLKIAKNINELVSARRAQQQPPPTLHLNTDGTHYRQPTAQQPRGYGNNAGFRAGIDLAAVAKGAADLL